MEDDRLLKLKRRIVWYCDTDLKHLAFDMNDDDESGDNKIDENQLVSELDKIIERVKETTKYGSNTNFLKETLGSNPSRSAGIMLQFKCPKCGNQNASNMLIDSKSGDSICLGVDRKGCGMVLQDHIVNEGAEKRNFEEVEDRNHHGSAPDLFMPDHVNLETRTVMPQGSSLSLTKFKQHLKDTQRIERQVMEVGHDDRRTTVYYKAQHKREVFKLMNEMACNLNLHEKVVSIAKEQFAAYREAKERVQQERAVVAACLVIAYADLLTLQSTNQSRGYVNLDKVVTYKKSYESSIDKSKQLEQLLLEDKAINTFRDVALTKFTKQQLFEWLKAVTITIEMKSNLNNLINSSINYIGENNSLETNESNNGPMKRKRDDFIPLFGTTTIKGREKIKQLQIMKSNEKNQSNSNIVSSSAGQCLARANFNKLIEHLAKQLQIDPKDNVLSIFTNTIKDAVRRRLSYESKKESEKVLHEKTGNKNSSVWSLLSSINGSSNNDKINEIKTSNEAIEDENVDKDLNDLLSEVTTTVTQFGVLQPLNQQPIQEIKEEVVNTPSPIVKSSLVTSKIPKFIVK